MNRGLLRAGAALLGVGAVLSAAGAAVGMVAVMSALRQHVVTSNLPPSELAMQHWRRAKAAAHAGADSWLEMPAQLPARRANSRLSTG